MVSFKITYKGVFLLTENGRKIKPLNIHLEELIDRKLKDLLSLSSFIFSMNIAKNIHITGLVYSPCLEFSNTVKPITEIFTSLKIKQCYLLKNPYQKIFFSFKMILEDDSKNKYGIDLTSRENYITLIPINIDGPYHIHHLNASIFREFARNLLEDFEYFEKTVQEEMIGIQNVLTEINSRSTSHTETLFNEDGSLLDEMYVNLKKIGEGQNGVVWKAYQPHLERYVAIKVLHPGIEGITRLEEFYLEIRSQGKLLLHDNIVPIFTVHDVVSPPFYVMEFIEGRSLEKVLQELGMRNEWLTIERSIEIVEACLTGLSHAHENGILHGDIKPGNIMITTKDEVKLSDFGCSRFLDKSSIPIESYSEKQIASIRASETYAAPEILRNEEYEQGNFSSDLFSLGLVIYVLFTKAHPFLHPSGLMEIKDLIMQEDYPAYPSLTREPRIPEEKAEIASSLLEKNRSKRKFRTASEVLNVWSE